MHLRLTEELKFLYPDDFADLVQQIVAVYGAFIKILKEELLGTLDDSAPFGHPDVFDAVDFHVRCARPDPVDRLERRGKERGLCAVER